MQLRQIHLQRFGHFQDRTIDFKPGLNVIRGPNEAGKSTLHQALLMVLLAQPTQTKKAEVWHSWNADQWYTLRLRFSDKSGNPYDLTKDFRSGTQTLILPTNETTNRDVIDATLQSVLGTNSLLVAQSTLCVEQDALTEIANGQNEIARSLEALLTGSAGNIYTDQALKHLDREIKAHRRGSKHLAKNPGPLAQAQQTVSDLRQRSDRYRQEVGDYERAVDELAQMNGRLEAIAGELGPLVTTLEQTERALKLTQTRQECHQREVELETKVRYAEAAQAEYDCAQSELMALGPVAELSGDEKRQIDQLASRLETLQEEYERYQLSRQQYELALADYTEALLRHNQDVANYEADRQAYDDEQNAYHQQLSAYEAAVEQHRRALSDYEVLLRAAPQQAQHPSISRVWLVWVITGLLAVIGSIVGLVLNSLLPGIVLLVGGLGLVGVGLWQRARVTPAGHEPPTEPHAPHLAGAAPPTLTATRPQPPTRLQPTPPASPPPAPIEPSFDRANLEEATASIQQQMATLGVTTLDELSDRYERAQALSGRQQTARARLETLLDGRPLAALEEQRLEASRQRRDADEQLADPALHRVSAMTPVDHNRLSERVAKLREEQSELQNRQQRLQGKLELQPVTHEDVLQAEEALEEAKLLLARTKERLAVYELASEMLTQARTQTLKHAQQRLGPQTAGYLQKLTQNRYQRVTIDSELSIRVGDPARPDSVILPERLSRGTQDQLYMAARLALVDTLFPHTQPPILLDDPFVHFDPQRLTAALSMCCEIAEQRQILLFTCSDRYDHVGHQIVLPSV